MVNCSNLDIFANTCLLSLEEIAPLYAWHIEYNVTVILNENDIVTTVFGWVYN